MTAQAMKSPASKHDQDLLLASNVSTFKTWLIGQGVQVIDPDPAQSAQGILFWAIPAPGSKTVSVQEGIGRNARHAQTHVRLRTLVQRFLEAPRGNKALHSEFQLLAARPDLLSKEDIDCALAIPSPVPIGATYENVFTVRTSRDPRDGMTVVAHSKVYGTGDMKAVEVLRYPIITSGIDVVVLADSLMQEVGKLPSATILVDTAGAGLALYDVLQKYASPGVRRYGVLMGKPTPTGRFQNKRAECALKASNAIKSGRAKLALPGYGTRAGQYEQLGTKMTYQFTDDAQLKVPNAKDRKELKQPCPDVFEVVAMAFLDLHLPPELANAPSAPSEPAAPAKPATPLTKELEMLRDDFAVACTLTQDPGESMEAFATRRWAYAQAMIDARPQ